MASLNKYRAKRTTYNGRAYPSTAEAEYARTLDLRTAAGLVFGWKRPDPIELIPGGRQWGLSYTPDFWVHGLLSVDGDQQYLP